VAVASSILRRGLALVAAAGALVGFRRRIATAAVLAGGLLNHPLAEVEKSGFFNWFNLAETARQPVGADLMKIDFRPTGPKFHDFALAQVTVDSNSSMVRFDLVLKRSFINSPGDGIFARDIAKSFILDAPPQAEDESYLQTLADEIQYKATSSHAVIVGPNFKPPKLPEPPTAAYLTFIGRQKTEQKKFTHCIFEIRNERDASGDDGLRISFQQS
jgi:hypothetical protein